APAAQLRTGEPDRARRRPRQTPSGTPEPNGSVGASEPNGAVGTPERAGSGVPVAAAERGEVGS
ncbi:hypothetical protein, partial [Plantactinospora alkalitolerans]|uniref:hypothetical protein n=1 Tax=Plantactinospora alkalitolerans TaxID=2789879 RepID=UPI001E522623